MKKALLAILGLLLTLGIVIWLGGVRIVVIQPIGAIPDGVTAIVVGVKNVNLIDSPDAICNRHEGGVSLWCRGREAAAIAKNGRIIARLPYSETLFWMTGAPELDR